MTDDFDDLKAALGSVPAPSQDAKARAIALAMENFDRLQGSQDPARSSEDRQNPAAALNGVRRMLTFLTSRPALAATTSVAALVIGVAVILPVADLRISQPGNTTTQPAPAEAPVAKATEAPAEMAPDDLTPDDLARADVAEPGASVAAAGQPAAEPLTDAIASSDTGQAGTVAPAAAPRS